MRMSGEISPILRNFESVVWTMIRRMVRRVYRGARVMRVSVFGNALLERYPAGIRNVGDDEDFFETIKIHGGIMSTFWNKAPGSCDVAVTTPILIPGG